MATPFFVPTPARPAANLMRAPSPSLLVSIFHSANHVVVNATRASQPACSQLPRYQSPYTERPNAPANENQRTFRNVYIIYKKFTNKNSIQA